MGIFIGGERYGFQVPDEAGPGNDLEEVIGNVNFPPIKALADGVHVAVVIIMPAFTERNHRENQAVTAVVAGVVPAATEQMGHGINAGGGMKEQGGADEKPPHQ